MFVVKYRKLFFVLSAALVIISIVAMFKPGFNFGIDFKGGTITEVSYQNRPAQQDMKAAIDHLNLGEYTLQPSGDTNYIIRTRELSSTEKETFLNTLSFGGKAPANLIRYNSVGPTVGNELRKKSYLAITLVVICIVLFVTFAFRKVSQPVASWKFGLATIIALCHDVIIPTGAYILISKFYTGGQIDVLFVSAILAILGYSVHDTIVVFDRVREHLRINRENRSKEDFETTVGKSVSETFGRSINTSLTIFLVLLVLYLIGGEATRNFSLVLLIGIIVGTYSSIFVASPLLITFEKMQAKREAK